MESARHKIQAQQIGRFTMADEDGAGVAWRLRHLPHRPERPRPLKVTLDGELALHT